MKKINKTSLFPLLALILIVYALSEQMFAVPPLGKLLDPFIGVVHCDDDRLQALETTLDEMELGDSVHIFFDDRKVPHIYAKREEDLYFAQGYVTAYLRLWEMDFLSYVSAGRMAEIFPGKQFLEYDRSQRRMGILQAAKAALKVIENDPETNEILTAYTRGVNAYVQELSYKRMPLEYKLLAYEPELWSNLKTVLILKHMGNTLSGYEEDLRMSHMMLALGEEKFNKLFPDFHSHMTPVVDLATSKQNSWASHIKKPEYLDYSFLSSGSVVPKSPYNPALGSNSWAISGNKTRSGFPILCNDPHLNLSLPSIWIEMQLSSPQMNVYGVSIPGTPAVTIGFNENIAWGITNGSDDVKDWYKLKITEDYKKYELDGKWVDLDFTIEEIKRRGEPSLYDTIYRTVHGPVMYDKSFTQKNTELVNHALKWELHNPSNEFLTFIKLNRAKNYQEYKDAIKHYHCPIQNFTFASKTNDIAIHHQGRMPVKSPGQGKFILDGTSSASLYKRYIPADSLPQTLNPSCNYVLSANQHPTGANYSYYYNGYFMETRANRIRQWLEKNEKFDIAEMEAMQLDNTNSFAVEALPVLIKSIEEHSPEMARNKLLQNLKAWNGSYDIADENGKLFGLWFKNIKDYTWDELKKFTFQSGTPDDFILLDIIREDAANDYFDKQGTSAKENAADIILAAFTAAVADYEKLRKDGSIQWGNLNKVNVMHLTNLPAFSKTDLPSAGHPRAINAMANDWGPSWRMIVELGDRPRAFGVYSGGQSGNVGSPYYDNFVSDWNEGKYYPLLFFMSMHEAKAQATNSWILK
jgi:penicillin G amidase